MTNLLQRNGLFWASVFVVCFALVGCSYGVDTLFRIIPPENMTPSTTFGDLNEMVGNWPELRLESKCEEKGTHYMNKYRLTRDKSIFVAVIFNSENGVIAFDFSQLGVNEFTPEARDFLKEFTSRLIGKLGTKQVVELEKNGNEYSAFEGLLMGEKGLLYFCRN